MGGVKWGWVKLGRDEGREIGKDGKKRRKGRE